MKFFHLGDLHIGKHLYYYSLMEDQKYALEQVIEAAKREHPDAVLISGDIYDKATPSAEAVRLLDWFLTELSRIEPQIAILMIAGNHDSGEKLEFVQELLQKNGVHIVGMPPRAEEEQIKKVVLEDEYGVVNFYLLPFTKPSHVRAKFAEEKIETYEEAAAKLIEKEKIDTKERNVILSHQFYTAGGDRPDTCDSEIRMVGGIDEIDVRMLETFDYAALGHIHRPQKIGEERFRYAGTLLKYSVSEADHKKSFCMITMGKKGSPLQIETLPVNPLRNLRVLRGNLQEILQKEDAAHDYVSITLTDEEEPYLPKERLELVFDHILEIRIDNARTRKILDFTEEEEEKEDIFTSFGNFFELVQGRTMSEAEQRMAEMVWNEIREGKE